MRLSRVGFGDFLDCGLVVAIVYVIKVLIKFVSTPVQFDTISKRQTTIILSLVPRALQVRVVTRDLFPYQCKISYCTQFRLFPFFGLGELYFPRLIFCPENS